ncbi:hypothetical protein Sjap_024879 [Stephania japonica]|uniref:1-phosphatidylinositol-3-phosphate 5-kinase n=1 Tax=Stephania japonica TaxID=461633 RepID=A0AAP0EHE6_9MAGN
MGMPDRSFLDLIEKVRSWIPWVGSEVSSGTPEYWEPCDRFKMCSECQIQFTDYSIKRRCQNCGRILCGKCGHDMPASAIGTDVVLVKSCKFCAQVSGRTESKGVLEGRSVSSPRQSPERPASCLSNCENKGHHLIDFLEMQSHGSPHAVAGSSVASSSGLQSSAFLGRSSSSRSDEEDVESSEKPFFSPSSEYYDIDSSSFSARHDFCSFKSVGSSPSDSPSRMSYTVARAGFSNQPEREGSPLSHTDAPLDQEATSLLRRPATENELLENTDDCSDNLSVFRNQYSKVKQPLDFENNGCIWFPPPPDAKEDDMESNFFAYDDDDDDVGDSKAMFSSSSFSSELCPVVKEKPNEEHKEPIQTVIHGHFRALVSQLLQGEGMTAGSDDEESWLDTITKLAWQAATFVKPDTSRGGSMDPVDYVKVKCIVAGSPGDSTLIKGVVCTKNIKHKRMISQYKNPRLLLLGGALEYQRTPNQLASFDTLLQQEIDHLKTIVSKIESHRTNVLLVEKSVSSYAQEYLLAKEISLVLNVKRPLLDRIARCTGAVIVPSIENLSSARLGQCEVFRVERVIEESVTSNQPSKKTAKNLMYFEGCPRRLGCTVLLKGASREVLKKVKHVVQYAVFAAYHLSLETSFLADEGATLPKMLPKQNVAIPERLIISDDSIPTIPHPAVSSSSATVADESEKFCESGSTEISSNLDAYVLAQDNGVRSIREKVLDTSSSVPLNSESFNALCESMEIGVEKASFDKSHLDLAPSFYPESISFQPCATHRKTNMLPSQYEMVDCSGHEEEDTLTNGRQIGEAREMITGRVDDEEISTEYFSTVENHQSILVSFSSRCVLKGVVCERSQLLRIKFYGSFDKPLGKYLHDDLFDQTSCCPNCKESTDAHVRSYSHQQGYLTINVKRLPSIALPGEREGKIWMWHRCLKCAQIDGVPPATRRVIMSDAAWGLSFGKFLELSFSNHATANRVASCGHSLQRDCLRYYGFGRMVAFFRYSPIDILTISLPPSMLDFNVLVHQKWAKREAEELSRKMEVLYAEVFDVLHNIEQKGSSLVSPYSDENEFHNHVADLKALLKNERNEYEVLLQPVCLEDKENVESVRDILELNSLKHRLFIDSYIWDCRLSSLDSLINKRNSISKTDVRVLEAEAYAKLKEWRDEFSCKDGKIVPEDNSWESSLSQVDIGSDFELGQNDDTHFSLSEPISMETQKTEEVIINSVESNNLEDIELSLVHHNQNDANEDMEVPVDENDSEPIPSPASSLSDKIDSAWTGTGQPLQKAQPVHVLPLDGGLNSQLDNPSYRKLLTPVRVYSFDSALRLHEKTRRALSPMASHLSSARSFHASGEYGSMVRDPVPNILKALSLSQNTPRESQKLNFILKSMPSFISSASNIAGEGGRLLMSHFGHTNMAIPVYDNEPTSIISYALCSKEYKDWIADTLDGQEASFSASELHKVDDQGNLLGYSQLYSSFLAWQSLTSLDAEDIYRSHVPDDRASSIGTVFSDYKKSPHVTISFGDGSSSVPGKVRFSVTCYFAKQFDGLRKKCCPMESDYIRSLCRCNRWNAQGGKSNVYFAKSLDERFIIKQVTKTELDSFVEFAPQYFKYLVESLSSRSPTCLAKVIGIYQVTVKNLKGGREMKMDLMVMENLFFQRTISRVYDLKGSARSRYNSDKTGKNKVLLDMNLLETLRTNPIFLCKKAKRSLERAVWNDTSFLASIDVMDYSLLVGVDDERKELVIGIIDFMRQYTWDKHLETWVKASRILGGPKNESPTVISPKQYKKRFRKAMSTYFLVVPDQWST